MTRLSKKGEEEAYEFTSEQKKRMNRAYHSYVMEDLVRKYEKACYDVDIDEATQILSEINSLGDEFTKTEDQGFRIVKATDYLMEEF